MSDSVRPHGQQPTRLPRPWDSPGKNTGVGCHFLLQCMKMKRESEVAQSYPTLSDPINCSLPGSSIHGVFQARVLEWGAIAFSKYVALVPKIKKKKNRSKRKTGFFIITAESQVEMHSMVHSDPSLLWIPGNALGTDFLSWYSDTPPTPPPRDV